jgi:hypothetical protein
VARAIANSQKERVWTYHVKQIGGLPHSGKSPFFYSGIHQPQLCDLALPMGPRAVLACGGRGRTEMLATIMANLMSVKNYQCVFHLCETDAMREKPIREKYIGAVASLDEATNCELAGTYSLSSIHTERWLFSDKSSFRRQVQAILLPSFQGCALSLIYSLKE